MENQMNAPAESAEMNMKAAVGKAALPMGRMILLGMMAGAFIALGGAASSTAVSGIADVGTARTVAGLIFPVGLIMIILTGGELFTGNSLMLMAALDGRITYRRLIRNLFVVYFSNLAGALLIDVLIVYSGNLDLAGAGVGAYAVKTAVGKAAITPVRAVTSGILCNILVCVAILAATAARDAAGKIWAVFFPIFAFVVGGFEHSVANMFYLPTGLMAAKNPQYASRAMEALGITAEQLNGLDAWAILRNLLFVTIGNLIGGMLFVAVPYYLINRKGKGGSKP